MTRDIEAQLRQLDAERERLQAMSRARHPDPDGGPEAVAARQERRMQRQAMTGQVERLVPARPTSY